MNNLQGEIIPSYMNLTQLLVLNLDGNQFTGTIEDRLLGSLSSLKFMDISNNEVTGGIPRGIGNISSLLIFLSSDNQFKGPIPTELCNLNWLEYLDLSNNELTGVIPSCNDSYLMRSGLLLNNNFLSGSIPNTLSTNSQLVVLDLSGNQFSGGIPLWIGNISKLNILLLGHNSLGGGIPETLCNLEQINIIDLSSNDISGSILPCFANMSFGVVKSPDAVPYPVGLSLDSSLQITSSRYFYGELDESWNREVVTLLTKGRYDDFNGNILNTMSVLDLSSNRLTGEIPRGLGHLDKLHSLNLSRNELSGSIPTSFSMMKNTESLDLSYNNLSGAVPTELAQLTFLEIFNVSYNNLSGTVPEAAQFASFDERNYMGNPLLCGFVGKSCGSTSKNASRDGEDDDTNDGFDWQVFFWSFGMSSVTLFLCINMVLLINPEWRRAWFVFSDYHILWWL